MYRRLIAIVLASLVLAPVALADRDHHRGYYGRDRDYRGYERHYRPEHRRDYARRGYYGGPRVVYYDYAPDHYHARGDRYERHYHDHCDEDYYLLIGGAMVLGEILHHAR